MPSGPTVAHPIKNLFVSAAVLAVWSQYPGAVRVKRPRAHSQVTPDAATVRKHSKHVTSFFLKQVKQIHLKFVCSETQGRGKEPAAWSEKCCCRSLFNTSSWADDAASTAVAGGQLALCAKGKKQILQSSGGQVKYHTEYSDVIAQVCNRTVH